MIRHIKRYLAIRDYAQRLSLDLVRRFGRRSFYSVEQVTKAVQGGQFSEAFIAYAHASFCSRSDFDQHYGPLKVACSYDGLRHVVARRFLSARTGFNAETLYHRFRQTNDHGHGYGDYTQADSGAVSGGGHGHGA